MKKLFITIAVVLCPNHKSGAKVGFQFGELISIDGDVGIRNDPQKFRRSAVLFRR